MFGWKEQNARYQELTKELQYLRMALEELTKTNEQAIINRQTITKFIDDLNNIVKITKVQTDKAISKKPGRAKRISRED